MHEMAGLLGDLEFPEKARLKSLARHAQIGLWDPALQVSPCLLYYPKPSTLDPRP